MWAEPGACDKSLISHAQSANCFEFWLNRYQTLIGGILTLIAGSFAYVAAQNQIKHAESLEEKRRHAEENAARVRLALTLSDISEYSTECARRFKLRLQNPNDIMLLRLPSFPQSVVESLERCIRFAHFDNEAELKNMLHWLQIFKARVSHRGGWDGHNYDYNVNDGILDAAKTIVFVNDLFAYAREGTAPWTKTPEPQAMERCLRSLGFNDKEHPQLFY